MINKDQIVDMEEEFAKLQKIEIGLKSDRSKTSTTIANYAASASLYTQQKKLEELIKEVEDIIIKIANTGRVRGKVMSQKTMRKFLDDSERRVLRQTTIDSINLLNEQKAGERISLYLAELDKEYAILKADIAIFKKRALLANFSNKDAVKQLVMASYDKAGPVIGFQKRIKSMQVAVLRREAQYTEMDEYRKLAKPTELWVWVAINTKPCPDCQIRAGVILPYHRWVERGLPGAGRTICGPFCMCKVVPSGVADGLFGEAREFTLKDGVLTTASELRTFKAKGNRI